LNAEEVQLKKGVTRRVLPLPTKGRSADTRVSGPDRTYENHGFRIRLVGVVIVHVVLIAATAGPLSFVTKNDNEAIDLKFGF
jgi:hypothetical protein